MPFYQIFISLCKNKGVSPSRAAEACGINRSNVSNWKNNGYTPRGDALQRIADYFNISTDYLLGNDQKEKPAEIDEPTDVQYRIISRNAKKMTPEQRQKLIDMARIVMGEEFDET